MIEPFLYVIIALLPLAAGMLLLEKNPFHALILRGILGTVATLVHALFGAGDVALTEALVGTLLSITLYAITIRSSLVLKVAMLRHSNGKTRLPKVYGSVLEVLKKAMQKRYVRIEKSYYQNESELYEALSSKKVHAICMPTQKNDHFPILEAAQKMIVETRIRSVHALCKPYFENLPIELLFFPLSHDKEES